MTDAPRNNPSLDPELDLVAQPELDLVAQSGHDRDNEMLHMTIPELAGAQTLARANVDGSPRARRQARIMAWLVLGSIMAVVLVGLIGSLL
jgi:hypothetical protein